MTKLTSGKLRLDATPSAAATRQQQHLVFKLACALWFNHRIKTKRRKKQLTSEAVAANVSVYHKRPADQQTNKQISSSNKSNCDQFSTSSKTRRRTGRRFIVKSTSSVVQSSSLTSMNFLSQLVVLLAVGLAVFDRQTTNPLLVLASSSSQGKFHHLSMCVNFFNHQFLRPTVYSRCAQCYR